MDIRACTEDDLAALRFHWPTTGRVHEDHHAQQATGLVAYLVAWRDDAPLGSGLVQWGGCMGPNAREAFPEAVEFNHLQVRSEFRGQGVGTYLISTAEALVWRRGRRQVGVGVADDNPEAERLYVRLGYRPTGIVDVCEYDWVTDEGQPQHARELNRLLMKRLSAG